MWLVIGRVSINSQTRVTKRRGRGEVFQTIDHYSPSFRIAALVTPTRDSSLGLLERDKVEDHYFILSVRRKD